MRVRAFQISARRRRRANLIVTPGPRQKTGKLALGGAYDLISPCPFGWGDDRQSGGLAR